MATVEDGVEGDQENGAPSRSTDKQLEQATAEAKTEPAVQDSEQSGETLTAADIESLLSVTWQAGALTKTIWNGFVEARDKRHAAEEVHKTIEALKDRVRPLEPIRPRPLARILKISKRDRYKATRLARLSSENARIRGEFLQLIGANNPLALSGSAQVAGDSLQRARDELRRSDVDVSIISSYLSLADGAVARLYPDSLVKIRSSSVLFRLKVLDSDRSAQIADHIGKAMHLSEPESLEAVRQALADALEALHQREEDQHLEDDLQLQRLRRVRRYVSAVLGMLVLASPLLVNTNPAAAADTQGSSASTDLGWPVPPPVQLPMLLKTYLPIIAIGVMGAAGGTLSGLLSARDSRTKLTTYRTDMIKLSLKPIVGALVAIALYMLLTWNVVPGISVISGGTYLALALLAGFSERFFLRLLRGVGEEPVEPEPRK
jgi:hypothetical protein